VKLEKTLALIGSIGLFWALAAAPAEAGNRFGKGTENAKGHVIKVEQQTRTGNDGKSTRLTIRTRKAARVLPDLLRISIPALRSRRQDIPILAERMILKYGGDAVRRISEEALQLLRRHPFPGNLRELEGLVERACLLADGEELRPEHFPDLGRQTH
jgi:hypothetical protein